MLIAAPDQDRLRGRFAEELSGDVRVRLGKHIGDCTQCAQAHALLTEVSALSDRLTLAIEAGADPCPEIRLEGRERGEVRFLGLPSGYEFPAFIDSLVDVSRGETSLSSDTVARLGTLRHRVHMRVFTTPT